MARRHAWEWISRHRSQWRNLMVIEKESFDLGLTHTHTHTHTHTQSMGHSAHLPSLGSWALFTSG